jgi:hypothetical protein
MIDTEGLESIRTSLAADGYEIDVSEEGERVDVVISAGPEACADCLVPQAVMVSILEQALKVPASAIDLTYPEESAAH